MKNIKLFENWLMEDEADMAKGCTITIANCAGKGSNVKPKANEFTVDSVSGTATVNGEALKAGTKVSISSPVTMIGKVTVKLSSADEDVEISCDGTTPKCTISGKE
jgi:hypothetical protein